MKLTNGPKCIKITAHFDGDTQMKAGTGIVRVQFIVVTFVSIVLYSVLGSEVAQAALFGGSVAMANTLFWVWCMRAGVMGPTLNARQELSRMVRFSLERFFLVALLMVAGFGWLKLMPAPMLSGFVLGQLTLVISTMFSGIEK